ncbi:sodium-dependent neutral amino acid transporter B(0)AT3-like [Varroa destructor]|uniref:Transporter n=1 Tax=Varroa destructor TaxID=109461 RepID=A0A7M7KMZ5_VARDE|nr:sodium-dependent neutral amino acid transporter B(0)AT3-like [Varroa destructor]
MQNILRKQNTVAELPVGPKVELREMQGPLLPDGTDASNHNNYGTTNQAFEADVATITGRDERDAENDDDERNLAAPGKGKKGHQVFKASCPEGAEDERESWDSELQFILATIGYAVGLGNVWRFPYLAQKNGGGAFLIPYFIMLAIEGLPIFYMELAVGQRLRKGAIGVWNLVSPFCGGIGMASAVVSFNVALYYNTIIAWCLYYFLQSFSTPLPWAECPHIITANDTALIVPECQKSSPTQYFWYRVTLDISPDIGSPAPFNYKIALCLVAAWILCYMCMIKGIASSGKVVYVTATFPYFVLIIFFFRGVTLEGMADGLIHLFKPDWTKLGDPMVWLEAGTQIFFSLGLAFGGLIAFSSYNPVHNNCFRDAVVVSFCNCATSMFAGIVVFSILGFKAHMTNKRCLANRALRFPNITHPPKGAVGWNECNLEEELQQSASGPGLAFIAFTEAINQFPGAPFWSVLFFMMLFTLGIDSQFGTLEGVVTSIVDLKLFPNLRKELLTGSICALSCVLSMIFAHGAGNYAFTLFDNFAGSFPLLIIALGETISIAWIYGLKRFNDDIELMTGVRPGFYFNVCWKFLAPVTMLTILAASFYKIFTGGIQYEGWDREQAIPIPLSWPGWCILLIIFLIGVSTVWIPLVAILRAGGVTLLPPEEPAWFPADELREFYGITEHEVTPFERWLFCLQDDRPVALNDY